VRNEKSAFVASKREHACQVSPLISRQEGRNRISVVEHRNPHSAHAPAISCGHGPHPAQQKASPMVAVLVFATATAFGPSLRVSTVMVTRPVWERPIARAAAGDRSMCLPRTHGPRSLILTVTHPLWQTRTRVPNAKVRWAAVSSAQFRRSPLAVGCPHSPSRPPYMLATSARARSLEPISKSPEQDDEASELNEAEEILGIVLPAHKDTTLPLYPGKEALYQPAPCVSPQSAAVLRRLLHTA